MPRRGVGQSAVLVERSFLRRADPRTKIALALAVSATVTLPLPPLAAVAACFAALLLAADVARPAVGQLWRARLWLALLFVLDWAFIGIEFAVVITLRLALLSASFVLVFATTTPDELRVAAERLGVSPRLAFAFATAFRSLGLVEREWRGIVEAQQARGIVVRPAGPVWRMRREDLRGAVALVVPAIVLATQRAWALSEAAAARGVESPLRRPYHVLRLRAVDHALLAVTLVVLGGSWLLR
jgi:energy-coupling factor transporter transmembrane protein EcfT